MLRLLELRENRLKDLPKSMCQLVDLERLDIGNNHFDIFVSFISAYLFMLLLFTSSLFLFLFRSKIYNNVLSFLLSRKRLLLYLT